MSDAIGQGFHDLSDSGNDYNATAAVVEQLINRVHTATVVKVVKVANAGGVAPVGLVDVAPQVKQIDGKGQGHPHGVIHSVPYFRLQGGANAVILDPQVGDLGIAVFASRDISNVKANKAESLPGSYRTHDMADGLYVGGFLNGAPTQYVQFEASGITLNSPTKVTVVAPEVDLNADLVKITGSSITHNGHEIGQHHKHTNTQPGGGLSGEPQ